jgi:hypothetical protein
MRNRNLARWLEEIEMEGHYLLQFFKYEHLPERLQKISQPFQAMAISIMQLPDNPERTTALRKLLESKDCAVRSALFQ